MRIDLEHLRSNILRLVAMVIAAISISLGQPLAAQTKSDFARIVEYGNVFKELNDDWNKQLAIVKTTFEDWGKLRERLNASIADRQSINSLAGQQFKRQVQEYIEAQSLQAPIVEVMNYLRPRGMTLPNPMLASVISRQINAVASVQNIEQQLAQLGVAERATAEQQFKLLRQIVENQQLLTKAVEDHNLLVISFLEQSDLIGTRCELENRAVLHGLAQADAENMGARLAASIALLRLKRWDAALDMLEALDDAPRAVQQICSNIRAEVLACQNKPEAAKKELAKSNKSTIAGVILLRARTFDLLGDSKNACREWEKLKDDDKFSSITPVCMALSRMSHTNSPPQLAKCLQDCEVADELTGQQNWLCKAALAIALHANQKPTEAMTAIAEASKLALGDKKQLCENLMEQIKAGQNVQWKW